jgi:HAD superfamily hydrolase (TIGR01509 family)
VSGELRAIIFDMDGTLADTEDLHRRAFNTAFAELLPGCEWSASEYHDLLSVSGGKERIRSYLRVRIQAEELPVTALQLTDAVHARKSDVYRGLIGERGLALRPGVRRLLDDAGREEIPIAIATSSSRRNVESLLGTTLGADALSRFAAIATSDEVDDKKPSPAVYRHVLDRLRFSACDCVAIEDTRNGNLAARGAGLKTVITTHRYTVDNDFGGAALVVDQLGEPDRPFTVRQGNARGATCVSIDLLRGIVRDRTA